MAGAGDFNGDGLADVAVGAPQSRAAKREGAGATFVVFGARRPGDVDVRALGTRGVEIDGEHEFANAGESLAPLGDINGDGRGDLLIGASQVSVPDRSYAGAAYVVFGRAPPGGSTCSGRARRHTGSSAPQPRPAARRARAWRWPRSVTSTATAAAT